MAPISNSTSSGIPQGGQGFNDSFWNFELPISRRGHFFQDAAFESAYEQLHDNVRRILQRWGETDFLSEPEHMKLRPSDTLSRFRQLRRHDLKEEDQAVTVASDATSHKIVMDVHDFVGGEVKARVEGERELVVEGRTETKTGDWSASSSSFRRRFCLPTNTDLTAVSAVLSDDGILTVTAPLKGATQGQGNVEVPLVTQDTRPGFTDARTSFTSSLTADNTQQSTCTCRLGQQARRSPRPGREHIIPIRVDEDLEEASHGSQASESTQAAKESQSREFTCHAKAESTARNTCETSTRHSQCAESPAASRASSVTSQASAKDKAQTQSSTKSWDARARSVPVNQLPITRRGLFFDDSFFASLHQDFQSAVNDVLGRWGEAGVLTDDRDNASRLGRYRQLREHNLNVESQAVTATSDETSHKIVMDVHDFVTGEVKARVEGERELVVEGRTENKTGDWDVSSNSFRRRFCLPPDTDLAAVSAVLSDDGILTVTAPRLTKQHQSKETTIPIHTEGLHQTRHEQAASTSSTTCGRCSAAASSPSATPSRQTSTIATQTDDQIDWSTDSLQKKKETRQVHKTKEQQSTQESVSLPITTRGPFFGDSFFKDSWQDFQAAVRDVVSKWGDPACPADDLTHYRSLRRRDLRDENQALRFTEDETAYKIVVDVQDFMKGGSVNVKAVQDRQLTVEGRVEQQTGGERYKKHFHRRFVLPQEIYSESVSSVVSADGVLTITAPKKPSALPLRETIIPVGVEEGIHRTESLSHVSEEFLEAQREARIVHQKRQEKSASTTATAKESSRQESLTNNLSSDSKRVARSREHIIPVVLEEEEENLSMSHDEERTTSVDENTRTTRNTESLESSHARADTTTTTTVWENHRQRRENADTFTGQTATSGNHAPEKIAESVQNEDLQTATATGTRCRYNTASETLTGHTEETENHAMEKTVESLYSENLKATSATSQRHSERVRDHSVSLPSVRTVPISLKGDFFSDSFFEDTREQFTTAVQDVLQQTDATASASDEVASYRSHLKSNRRLENQAAHVEEDTRCFKVVLDVHEFVGGELKVEVEDGKALVVEGQASFEEGASSSTLTFRRIFSLPSQADVAAITSALSSDGVLTILTPKLQREAESPAACERAVKSHSRQEHSAAMEAWEGQRVRQEVTKSKRCYSEAYRSSSSSGSTNNSSINNSSSSGSSSSSSRSSSCTQQQFSSHNVF